MSWKVQNGKGRKRKNSVWWLHIMICGSKQSRVGCFHFSASSGKRQRDDDVQVWYDCAWSVPPEKCARVNNEIQSDPRSSSSRSSVSNSCCELAGGWPIRAPAAALWVGLYLKELSWKWTSCFLHSLFLTKTHCKKTKTIFQKVFFCALFTIRACN